jgi:RNA polymerase sigma factor (TIGR02999 family)
MSEVTRILTQIESGGPGSAEQLLPLVYDELRKLAARKLSQETPGQTLQPTALVHEAYLRLVNTPQALTWDSRGHFFAAAAEAMRRILVERARRKRRVKHGGELHRADVSQELIAADTNDEMVLAVDESLEGLARQNETAAKLVNLRFFAGLTLPEAAAALGVSPRTADRLWAYAKAWLHDAIK